MNKEELLETLEDSRQELIEMVENLPETTLLEPGVQGDWSIKDILAHLTYWEGQLITLLYQAKRGVQQPGSVHFGKESVDELNARWYEQGKDRPIDQVWNDFAVIRKQTIRRVSEFTDKDLNDPERFPWLENQPLWQWVLNDTIEHEEEHADLIRDWLDQRENKTNGSRPG